MLRLLTAATVLVAGAPPAQVTQYATDKPAEIAVPPDKIVCKKEARLGTRLGEQRVCLTDRQWKEVSEDNRELIERIRQGCAPACP